jgi:hypothetical protein
MEAARISETLANFYQTTRCYNPEDSHLITTGTLNYIIFSWFYPFVFVLHTFQFVVEILMVNGFLINKGMKAKRPYLNLNSHVLFWKLICMEKYFAVPGRHWHYKLSNNIYER